MAIQEGERCSHHDNQEGERWEETRQQFCTMKHGGVGTWTGGLEEVRTVFPVAEKVRGDVSMYQGLYRNKAKQ